MTYLYELSNSAKVFIAGHRGMVGSAIHREMKKRGFSNLCTISSTELDLRDRLKVLDFFRKEKPEIVILAAARVGGILANDKFPAEFFSDNMLIQLNVMDAAHSTDVARLLFLGSSCIYPKYAAQPISEDQLMTGPLETTNDAYAIAKIAGIQQVKSMRKQYGHSWISVMPSNLYGIGDSYDSERSHVLPALIRRYEIARIRREDHVTNWGSGKPRREFLFADDLADACLHLLQNYDNDEHINVGSGEDLPIADLAKIVSTEVGYEGATIWDHSKPDGTPRKLMDISKVVSLGWEPKTRLKEGIALAVADFRARFESELKSHK